jgi:multidrug resistance efflux pump
METAGQEIGRIETRLRQLGAKLDKLAAKADEAQGEAETEATLDYRRLIDFAKSKQATVRGKLDAYKAANGQKWDNFKGAVELAWRELASAFKAVKQ